MAIIDHVSFDIQGSCNNGESWDRRNDEYSYSSFEHAERVAGEWAEANPDQVYRVIEVRLTWTVRQVVQVVPST